MFWSERKKKLNDTAIMLAIIIKACRSPNEDEMKKTLRGDNSTIKPVWWHIFNISEYNIRRTKYWNHKGRQNNIWKYTIQHLKLWVDNWKYQGRQFNELELTRETIHHLEDNSLFLTINGYISAINFDIVDDSTLNWPYYHSKTPVKRKRWTQT